ncbi:MAG: hypothetical protein E5W88_22655, partial [Mesorhizobium sp.]
APHLPAGILSPYRDGERGACRRHCGQLLSPRLRGEMSGRTVRGSADGWSVGKPQPYSPGPLQATICSLV